MKLSQKFIPAGSMLQSGYRHHYVHHLQTELIISAVVNCFDVDKCFNKRIMCICFNLEGEPLTTRMLNYIKVI